MTIIILILFLFVYFLPTIIANTRRHKYLSQVFMLNLLIGWTGIGYLIAIAWSLVD